MEHSNVSKCDITEICEKLRNIKDGIKSRESWQNSVKLLEDERDFYRKLYNEQVQRGSNLLSEHLSNIKYKERYEIVQRELAALQDALDKLLQEKDAWETTYATMQVAHECSLEAKESDYKRTLDDAMRQLTAEKSNMEANFRRKLNECHAKLRAAISTNNQLKCENAELQMLIDRANSTSGGAGAPVAMPCDHREEIAYYKNLLLHHDVQINELLAELNEKRRELHVLAQTLHAGAEGAACVFPEQRPASLPSQSATVTNMAPGVATSTTDGAPAEFCYAANPLPELPAAKQTRASTADEWSADDYERYEELYTYKTAAISRIDLGHHHEEDAADDQLVVTSTANRSLPINAVNRDPAQINRILAARLERAAQSKTETEAASVAQSAKPKKRKLLDESMLNLSQSQH